MIRAACHCGAVRITVEPDPTWVGDCNCSICRRYGALWAYARDFKDPGRPITMTLVQGLDDLEAYLWAGKELAFWRCRHCGCVTHHTVAGHEHTAAPRGRRFQRDFSHDVDLNDVPEVQVLVLPVGELGSQAGESPADQGRDQRPSRRQVPHPRLAIPCIRHEAIAFRTEAEHGDLGTVANQLNWPLLA